MNILNISATTDIAADGIRTKRAFDRRTDWTYRVTRQRDDAFEFPADLPWRQAKRAFMRADVIHLRDGYEAEQEIGLRARHAVVHHHGSAFRANRDALIRIQRHRRFTGLAATLDLYLMAPDDLTWLPAPYDLEAIARYRRPTGGALRVAHAPTDRDSKSTAAFLDACRRLNEELPVEVVLIERVAWEQCLAAKGTADIYFDQVLTGYGNNAIEAWGMGIPVIAGVDAAEATRRGHPIPAGTLDEMVRRFGSLPFVLADEGTIYEALRLLAEPSVRTAWAERGLAHVRAFHDEAVVVPMLRRIYEAAA